MLRGYSTEGLGTHTCLHSDWGYAAITFEESLFDLKAGGGGGAGIHLTKGTLSSWWDSLLKVFRDQDYPIWYSSEAESYKRGDNMIVFWLRR